MSSIDPTAPRPDHPWLAEFDANPMAAFDGMIRGVAVPFPYSRGEPREALALLFGALSERDPLRARLDATLGDWLDQRRLDRPDQRAAYGVERAIQEISDALHLVYRLELPETAARLREGYFRYRGWLGSLRLNSARDALGEFWTALAHHQTDGRFLSRWYHLCEEAALDRNPGDLSVALLGLRRLPPDGAPKPLDAALHGLALWGARLGEQDHARFRRQWRALRALYPRGPEAWLEHVLPLLKDRKEPFADWWREDLPKSKTGKGKGRDVQNPPRERLQAIERRIGREPIAQVRPDIEHLIAGYLRYAEATGVSHFVVRTACNIGDRVLTDAPDLAHALARIAVRWEPENPFAWTLWSKALVKLGQDDLAELLLWETTRRFPDNVVSRNALAELLARTPGRAGEAEALYRATMARFPDDVVSRTALAELLARTPGRAGEAEALYRATMARFPDNVVSRTALAELLARTPGRAAEAEALYRATMEAFPDNEVCRGGLITLLIRQARYGEADDLLPELFRLDVGSASRLSAALDYARRGEEPFPGHDPSARSHTGVAVDADAETLRDDGLVARSGFRLGALALDDLARAALRQAALDDLEDLRARRPDHAGVWLLTLRQEEAAQADRAARWSALAEAFPNDYGLRLDLARRSGDAAGLDTLLHDAPRRAPVTRLARLQAGGGAGPDSAEDRDRVEEWLTDEGTPGRLADDPAASFVWRRLDAWTKAAPTAPFATLLRERAAELEGLLADAALAATQEAAPLIADQLFSPDLRAA